jgi:hypothetical protein
MDSLPDNKPLLWSLAVSLLAIVGLLLGSSPDFNSQFGLVDIPVEVSGSAAATLGLSLADSRALTDQPAYPCSLSWSSPRSWSWTSAWHSWPTVSYSSSWGPQS